MCIRDSVKTAFNGSALAGGAMGTMVVAMQKGIARGIFSNESGLGSAPIAAAAAQTCLLYTSNWKGLSPRIFLESRSITSRLAPT